MRKNLINESWVKVVIASKEWKKLVKQYNDGVKPIKLSQGDIEHLYQKCGRPEDDNAYDELDAIEQFIGDLCAIFKKTVDNNVECWSCDGLRIQITKE